LPRRHLRRGLSQAGRRPRRHHRAHEARLRRLRARPGEAARPAQAHHQPRRHREHGAVPETGGTVMRVILVLIVLLAGVAMAAEPLPSPDSPTFARAVLERVDDLYRGEQAHGVMEMEVKTRHWTRSMQLESW